MWLCLETPVALDTFILFDFKFIVAAVAAFGFCFCGGGEITGFYFSGEVTFLQIKSGHRLARQYIHGFCTVDRVGGFDLDSDFCSRFAHQKGVDLVCDFFGVSDSGYEVSGTGGIISS